MIAVAELKSLHAEAATQTDRVESQARAALEALGDEAMAPRETRRAHSAWAHLALGACGLARTDVAATLTELATGLEIFGDTGQEDGVLAALVLLVNAWVMVGDRPEARLTAGRALRLARRLNARATEARLLVNLAYTHGEDDDAVAYEMLTTQALEIFESLGDLRAMAHCHVNLGGALTRSAQWPEARVHYDRAEKLCRQVEAPYVEALLWAGRGGLALALGDWESALGLYAESNRRLSLQGRDYQRLRQEWMLARDLWRFGEAGLAESKLTMALAEVAAAGYDGLSASINRSLAELYEGTGRRREAAQHADDAERLEAMAARRAAAAPSQGVATASVVARVRTALGGLRPHVGEDH